MEQGLCSSREEANVFYLDYRQHHITPPLLSLQRRRAFRLFAMERGIAVLAHPDGWNGMRVNIARGGRRANLPWIRKGWNAIIRLSSFEQQQRYVALASEKGLYRSGGSDFHHKEHTDTGINRARPRPGGWTAARSIFWMPHDEGENTHDVVCADSCICLYAGPKCHL